MSSLGLRSTRRSLGLLIVPLAIVLGEMFSGVATASQSQSFAFQKDCQGAEPVCTIHDASAPFEFLNQMAVWYGGPGQGGKVVRDGRTFISYGVTIGPSDREVLATGHFRWLGTKGSWTIRGGDGVMAGLHAQGEMSFVGCEGDTCTYALMGSYHIDP